MTTTFIFDLDALCGFAGYVVQRTLKALDLDLTEENWPSVAEAIGDYIDLQIERTAFAAEASAEIAAIPVTQEGVTPKSVSEHRTEFGL